MKSSSSGGRIKRHIIRIIDGKMGHVADAAMLVVFLSVFVRDDGPFGSQWNEDNDER
jgi:hypothetical protein